MKGFLESLYRSTPPPFHHLHHLIPELEGQVEVLEPESQEYKGGNVTVEDPTPSFSPSHSPPFSHADFITYAFPDIAMDLDPFT